NPHVAPPPTSVDVSAGPEPNRLYPARPGIQLFKLSGPPGRTTAACGLGVYRDDLLGPAYTGNTFTCEPVNLIVHRLRLEPGGRTAPRGPPPSPTGSTRPGVWRPSTARTDGSATWPGGCSSGGPTRRPSGRWKSWLGPAGGPRRASTPSVCSTGWESFRPLS